MLKADLLKKGWSERCARARDRFRRWLSWDWRLVPFYVAAILVSIAALRYILSE